MAGPETTIVHLHVKNLPAKYFAHQPNIFRKKSFFLTVVKTVMLKLSPICQRIDEKYCKIHVYSHSCSMPPFWIGFRCQKLAGLKNIIWLSVAKATLAPDFRFLKNSLSRPREKFSKQIWRPRSKQCSNNQNNLTSQLPGQKYRPEILINGQRP